MRNYDTVSVIDKAINTVIDAMAMPGEHHDIAVNKTETCLCITISAKDIVFVTDTSTGTSYALPLEKVTVPGAILLVLQ
jgi:DNA-binding beta-propeller fold protein YncE